MIRISILVIVLCLGNISIAQKSVPPLERMVTVTLSDVTIGKALEVLSVQTEVKFSYNPSTIRTDKHVSVVSRRKPLRTVLQLLFDETVQFKQKGNYIILTYSKPSAPVKKKAEYIIVNISGYVFSSDSNPIPDASIYNRENLIASISNQYGYYQLATETNRLPLTLKVAKEHFADTSVSVKKDQLNMDIILYPKVQVQAPMQSPPKTEIVHDTVHPNIFIPTDTVKLDSISQDTINSYKSFFQRFSLSKEIKVNLRNIKDTFFTKTQVGLVPYVSTNKLLSGNTINDYSFNILIGYSQGVNVFEIGGLMNIDRGNVQSFQAAGLINAVGGDVKGVQLAGWGNITKGKSDGVIAGGIFNMGTDMRGIQLAGITNINLSYPDSFTRSHFHDLFQDTVSGIQAAGIVNVNAGYTEGIRLAGNINLGNSNKGFQVAGLLNSNYGKSEGVNIAGLLNIMLDSVEGHNIAGLSNISGSSVKGSQVAGLFNITKEDVRGAQIASIFNSARNVTGTQLALINIADSVHGIPIGLVSFVRKGYHKAEILGDDILFTQLAFRTGVPAFHNIFNIGIDLTNRANGLWNIGYGIGSTHQLSNQWGITADIIAQTLIHQYDFQYAPSLLNGHVGIERNFNQKFSIAIGPTFHALYSYGDHSLYPAITSSIVPYSISETTYGNGNMLRIWVGGKISFKFL
jgi:hypothetical protein